MEGANALLRTELRKGVLPGTGHGWRSPEEVFKQGQRKVPVELLRSDDLLCARSLPACPPGREQIDFRTRSSMEKYAQRNTTKEDMELIGEEANAF
eukprot:6492059-Amphidinium_carterae.1